MPTVANDRMPDDKVVWTLTHMAIVLAHHAAFDGKWIERRSPDA